MGPGRCKHALRTVERFQAAEGMCQEKFSASRRMIACAQSTAKEVHLWDGPCCSRTHSMGTLMGWRPRRGTLMRRGLYRETQ